MFAFIRPGLFIKVAGRCDFDYDRLVDGPTTVVPVSVHPLLLIIQRPSKTRDALFITTIQYQCSPDVLLICLKVLQKIELVYKRSSDMALSPVLFDYRNSQVAYH